MGSDRGDRLRGRRSLHLLRDRAPQVRARRRPPGDVHLRRRSNPGARRARPARRPRGLARLGYKETRSVPPSPGLFRRSSDGWDIYLRGGDETGAGPAQLVRLQLADDRITKVTRSGQDAGAVALEPEVLSSAADRPGEDHKPIRLDE